MVHRPGQQMRMRIIVFNIRLDPPFESKILEIQSHYVNY